MSYVGKVTDYGGTTHLVGSTLYGTCSTQPDTAAKVVVCSDFNKLITGVTIHVKFSLSNTAASPTLNVNSTGAKSISKGSSSPAESTSITWNPNSIVSFTYDGTNWVMNDIKDYNVQQYPVSTPGQYEVLFSHSANNTAETAIVGKNDGFLYNPNIGAVTIGNRASGTVGARSFAQGESLVASGVDSHAEGYTTTASGVNSHAEGYGTIASGGYSHAEGNTTKATHKSQHVFGECNISDPSTNASTARGTYVEIVGNGTSSATSNARTLDWSGNQWIAGNYSDTNGLLAMKEVTQAQYDALTTAEKNNGTAYFITDRLSPAATDLWAKVGTATLTTVAQGCSGAINELHTKITDTHNVTELLDVSGINAMTTATSKDLSDEFTNYEYLLIQLRAYNNIYQTTLVTSSYFNGTGSGTRPILMGFNTSGTYLGAVEVYKNTTSKVYIKTSSGNTFNTSYRIYIIGIMKKL